MSAAWAWVGQAAGTVWKATKKADQWKLAVCGAVMTTVVLLVAYGAFIAVMQNHYRLKMKDFQLEPADHHASQ